MVSDSTTDKLTLDEGRLLAVQFDHGLPAFPEPRVTLNQARLDAIWRKFQHISDSERNFKQGPRMPFLQTLELKPDAKPRIAKVYPQSPEALAAMKKEFDKLREYGFVIEGSSTWSAPSFTIKKKNGEYCIVTNFPYLNSQLVPVMFPLLLISDLKMVVANKTIFSKFDVAKALYSIKVREKDWHLLSTGTSFGSFLYTVVPMGLTTRPSVMTRCIFARFIMRTARSICLRAIKCFALSTTSFSLPNPKNCIIKSSK